MSEVKVLIVEDEPIIAEDIATSLMNNDFDLAGIAYNKEDALLELKKNNADIVLLDINLNGGEEGIEIAEEINKTYHLPFIFLTSYSDKSTLLHAKNSQPAGYIVKPFTDAGLYACLEIALFNHAQKNNHLFPEITLEAINSKLENPLSDREFEVIKLIYDGKTNNQIAESLFVSINTIKAHIKNVYFKLDVGSRSTVLAKIRLLIENKV